MLTGAKLFPVLYKSHALIIPVGELMLMEGFSVLLKWLEKPPHFVCSDKTNLNYSYSRLSFSQSYKFIPIHPLSYDGHMSQSQSQSTTPTAVTGSVFPSSCSNFLSLTLNFGPHVWEANDIFLDATLFKVPFTGKKTQLQQMHACEKLLLPIVIPTPSMPKSLQTAFRCNTSKNMKQGEDSKHIKITEDLLTSDWCSSQCISFVGEGDSLLITPLLVKMGNIFCDRYSLLVFARGSIRRRAGKNKLIFL